MLVKNKRMFYAGASVDVYSDELQNFKGMFFQDEVMKNCFNSYPEIVFIDATYKLLDINTPVYVMLVEDSNGQSEIVFTCLLVHEDQDSVKWMMEIFKERNSNWQKMRVVMADKDMDERHVIKEAFPSASMLICLFHVLRTFKREISCEKLGITPGQRVCSLELLQKMAYASSENEYQALYDELQDTLPQQVIEYFNSNWQGIRDEWVLHGKAKSGSFLNSTNNRLESINAKLKQVIKRHSSLKDFITSLFIIIQSLRLERDHKAATMIQKVKVCPFEKGSAEAKYSEVLTSYASAFVTKQLNLASKLKNIVACDDGNYQVQSVKPVSINHCACLFRQSMLLPCQHIFAVRRKLDQSLYSDSLYDKRWTKSYYCETQRIFINTEVAPSSTCTVTKKSSYPVCALSEQQKYKNASVLALELASIASKTSGVHYERRCDVIKRLTNYWKCGEEVSVVKLTHGM